MKFISGCFIGGLFLGSVFFFMMYRGDVNHLNAVKFGVGILPADEYIRDISKQIKEGDTINVSGIYFKHSKVMNGSKEEPISHCLANTDVFYLTGLEIE